MTSPIRAAIYARKSTDQRGVTVAERSVTRQVEQSRRYATSKGWTVVDEHIYVDDGISGAEFANRPGFLRLMNSVKPRAPFQALIMSEESRLGREAIETAFAMKQIITSGVRVFFYLEDRERTLDSPTDKVLLSLTTFADELEREKARQRTYDALQRKARAGQVTGGTVFGYDNVRTEGGVTRRINESQAVVVRKIFELYAGGLGVRGIAKRLNDQGAVCPRPQRGRPAGWASSSVWAILDRPLYRGEVVWGQTRKRDRWGLARRSNRDAADWIVVAAPELRIVPEALCQTVDSRRAEARASYLATTGGERFGRPPNAAESKYLLTGFLRCGQCGGGLIVRSRSHGARRAFFYACSSYHFRGTAICANGLDAPLEVTDTAILNEIERYVLHPKVVRRALTLALEELQSTDGHVEQNRSRLRRELQAVDDELTRLTEALASGGDLRSLVEGIRARERRRDALVGQLGELERARDIQAPDAVGLERSLRAKLADWRSLLRGEVHEARQMLRTLVEDRITFTPDPSAPRVYRYQGRFTLGPFLAGMIDPRALASPTGTARVVSVLLPRAA